MQIHLFLVTFAATAFTKPVSQQLDAFSSIEKRQAGPGPSIFFPNEGTKVVCSLADKVLSSLFTLQGAATINSACAAMMPPCAYKDRVPADTICIQTIDFPLSSTKSYVAPLITINNALTDKPVYGFGLNFTVIPNPAPTNAAGVFWSKDDCYGYFAYLLGQKKPLGCAIDNGLGGIRGFGIGSLTVGGNPAEFPIAGSIFSLSFVPV